MKFLVRELVPEDATTLREIRLETLQHYGDLFSKLYEEEKKKSLDYWTDQATEKLERCYFGLFDEDKMIGVNAARLWEENPKLALGWGNFLRPEYRGQRVAKLLYQARMNWVEESGLDGLIVYLLDGNVRPTEIFNKQGAKRIFSRKMSFSGGPEALFHWYRLDCYLDDINLKTAQLKKYA